jgi:hypothetical protein
MKCAIIVLVCIGRIGLYKNVNNGLGLAQHIDQVAKTFCHIGFNPMWDMVLLIFFLITLGFGLFEKIRNERTVGSRYFKTFKELLGFMI